MNSVFPSNIPNISILEIKEKIAKMAKNPLLDPDSTTLGPVGNGSSQIFFLGEAPGPNDAREGEIMTGPYSQIFNQELLPSVGLNRKEIYLTNVIKNSQKPNQPPSSELVSFWQPLISLEIAAILPKLIVCMGAYALEIFLPNAKISQLRGHIFNIPIFANFSAPVLFLLHPANAHRFPEQKNQIVKDFILIQEFLLHKISPANLPLNLAEENYLLNDSLF